MRLSWIAGVVGAVALGVVPSAGWAFESAPPLEIGQWVTGEPVDLSQEGKTYVVELWATWCGPCRESLPHLAALQREHPESLAVVALSDERLGKVQSFVARNAFMSDVATAVDPGGKTTRALSEQFGVRGIPHAFVLNHEQQVLWHGHPNGMPSVLAQVRAGHWTPDSAKQLEVAAARSREYLLGVQAGPTTERLEAVGREALEKGRHAANLMNDLAWTLLTEVPEAHRSADFALEVAEAAVAASESKDHAILDTHALALWTVGRGEEARRQQKRALAMCRAEPDEDCASYVAALARYEQ